VKIFLAACLLVLSFSFFVQDNTSPILWQKKALRWKNFVDVPDSVGPHAKALALTNSRLEQRYYRVGNEIHFIIAAWFNPKKSWVRDEVRKSSISDHVLRHEQHHFDMCELYARKIRKYLGNEKFTDSTFVKEINFLFNKFHIQYRAEQNKYDNEATGHAYVQDNWTSSIDDEMKQLARFSDTLVVVKLQ
jgi:hypothetical protein